MLGAALACTGDMGRSENQGAPDEVDEDGNPVGGTGVPVAPMLEAFTPAPARLALLTAEQYRSSLADLLAIDGAGIDVPGDVPLYGFSTVGASSLSASATTVDLLDRSVREEVEKVFADADQRQSLTGCSIKATGVECVDAFIRVFGRRAFRRPLQDAEQTRLRSLYDTVVAKSDRWRGLQMVTMALLVSPKFLYQTEMGVTDADNSVQRALTGFETASRLSFWLTGSTPDDELLDAAEQGELVDGPGIRKQALRLLDGPRASDALIRFFGELCSLPVDRVEKDADKFPFVAKHPEIGNSMRNETSTLVSHIVLERDGNIAEVLDSDLTFVDPLLAEFYGATGLRDADGKVRWPDDAPRGGLLTHAGILSVLSKESSTVPTKRGRFVRERILCQEIPDPPPDVVMQLPDATMGPVATQRQRLDVHNIKAECKACHELLDPVGLVLERFDAAGLYRETENGATIDTSGSIDDVAVSDARELGRALRAHPDMLPCVFKQLYRYATGHLETEGEAPLVAYLGAYLANGAEGRFRDAMLALAEHPGFRMVAAAAP